MPRQDKIIKNYYEHRDTIMVNKLSELVSDLYLATPGSKQAGQLWERAAAALMKTQVDPSRMSEVLKSRDVEQLAKLVGELAGKPAVKGGGATPASKAEEASSAGNAANTPGASSPSAASNTSASSGSTSTGNTAASQVEYPTEELNRAMKAFRKRLKLARLDATSGTTRRPLTGGKPSVVAIQPPSQFPRGVWQELVRRGRLESAGGGMYQLPGGK